MAAAPRDMTPGELEVKLDSLISLVTDMSKTMVTRDVFDAWQRGNDDRIRRLEDDLKQWIKESTEAHISLEKDSKARHQESAAELRSTNDALRAKIDKEVSSVTNRLDKEVTKINTRQDETDKQRVEDERDLKRARQSSVNIWIVAGLAILGNITTFFVTQFLGR